MTTPTKSTRDWKCLQPYLGKKSFVARRSVWPAILQHPNGPATVENLDADQEAFRALWWGRPAELKDAGMPLGPKRQVYLGNGPPPGGRWVGARDDRPTRMCR